MALEHSPRIVTDGLVLALDAADRNSYVSGSTTWYDLAGSNNGTLVNGPAFDSANGGSIVFDGIDDYGTLSINSGLDGNNITLNVIAKAPPSQSQAILLFIFNRADYLCIGNYTGGIDGPPNGESFSLVKFNPTNLASTIRGGEFRFTDDKYHDFVFTRANNVDRFYVDGVLVGSISSTQTIASQIYPIEIGQRVSSPSFKQITSSIYRIYNRALTSQEVLQNYNATKTRFGL